MTLKTGWNKAVEVEFTKTDKTVRLRSFQGLFFMSMVHGIEMYFPANHGGVTGSTQVQRGTLHNDDARGAKLCRYAARIPRIPRGSILPPLARGCRTPSRNQSCRPVKICQDLSSASAVAAANPGIQRLRVTVRKNLNSSASQKRLITTVECLEALESSLTTLVDTEPSWLCQSGTNRTIRIRLNEVLTIEPNRSTDSWDIPGPSGPSISLPSHLQDFYRLLALGSPTVQWRHSKKCNPLRSPKQEPQPTHFADLKFSTSQEWSIDQALDPASDCFASFVWTSHLEDRDSPNPASKPGFLNPELVFPHHEQFFCSLEFFCLTPNPLDPIYTNMVI